ncbi:bifunctional glutamate N-acetyltransferase/amino-acid acetyltransferase ArgJ [soil metagenome]
MRFDEAPRFPAGFRCASRHVGLKAAGNDLSLFYSEVSATAAALFTRNRFPGAPIIVGREIIRAGRLRAIVVNSKVSNVGRGTQGVEDARRMGEAAAAELGVPASEVLMSSTGVIGNRLPIEKIESGIRGMSDELIDDPLKGAEGIMTTDTYPKAISMQVGAAVLTIVAKGSGMIEPNLATMLVYIFTDAEIEAAELDTMLRSATADSFNMLSVDSDTSTSDSCVIMANGLAGPIGTATFSAALQAACVRMTELLARDGEGASKLLRARVMGAASDDDARIVARSIINSPLVKTMAFGADPNVGRILMAVGKCFDVEQDPAAISIWINGTPVFATGARAGYDDDALRLQLAGDPVEIRVDLAVGSHSATAYGCDLTHGYVEENAAYYSS